MEYLLNYVTKVYVRCVCVCGGGGGGGVMGGGGWWWGGGGGGGGDHRTCNARN